MSNPNLEYIVRRQRKLNPWEGYGNSVNITVDTKSQEFFENPITGIPSFTGRSNTVSQPIVFNIHLQSISRDHIIRLLHNQLNSSHRWLCRELSSFISMTANYLGFGLNGFAVDILVKITYRSVVVLSDHQPPLINHEESSLKEKILRTVLLGRITRDNLKIETEPCSICLDDLSDSSSKHGFPTRMSCSHVFHGRCLLEWLHRKNTCPLCRTVLYDR